MTVLQLPKMKEVLLVALLFHLQLCKSIPTAPPIEPCPRDSVQVEDTCKCDPKLCSKPPCPYELRITANGTDSPGSCCPEYTCAGCDSNLLIEGKCPCAPNATLSAAGECTCTDPQRTLVGGECVCAPERCTLPEICEKNSVPVSEKEGCCRKTKCARCPEDSFATNYEDTIENKCVCYPCTKKCNEGERAVVIHSGTGFPGGCCDLYKCVSIDEEKKCFVDGIVYLDGDTWKTKDAQTCSCISGISFCSKPNDEEAHPCHKEGKVYKHNESWLVDSCTNCTCFNGEAKCIAHWCDVTNEGHLKKPECPPLNCSRPCLDGYRVNKRGCKTCKCVPYKYEDLLNKYNISRSDLKQILDDYFARNATEQSQSSTVKTVTTTNEVSDSHGFDNGPFSTPDIKTVSDDTLVHKILWPLLLSILAIGVVVILLLILIRKCKSHGSYDTNPASSTVYEPVKLKKEKLYNNNYIKKNIKGSV